MVDKSCLWAILCAAVCELQMMRGKFTKIVWRELQKVIAVISLMSNSLNFWQNVHGCGEASGNSLLNVGFS
jgi:hypothetical protein